MPSGDLLTVRIPELPGQISLSNEDRIALWVSSDNKTRYATLATLREFIEIGSSGTYGPVQTGENLLYIVPSEKEGDDFVSIPGIAGMNFALRRDGIPLKPQNSNPLTPDPDAEFEILSGGGFQLINDAGTLYEGQRYEIDVYEFDGGTIIDSPTGGSGFIQGNVPVPVNYNISPSDMNKVIQVRGGSNALTVSLPDVSLCKENSFIIIECLINNSKQHQILPTGGQFMYMDNESKERIYIGKGEVIWFYMTEEGWYAIEKSANTTRLGIPHAAYKVGFNQLLCNGQLLNRSDYPRLWEFVQTLGMSLVDDATWSTASVTVAGRTVENPYKGCYSTGNGSTTFRIPDLMGHVLRGLTGYGSSDTQRHHNHPGGRQKHEVLSHDHNVWGQDNLANPSGNSSPELANVEDAPASDTPTPPAYYSKKTSKYGGSETRMDNIGVFFVIDY